MDLLELLKLDLDNGFTKSELERIIGLPKNCLTEVLKGKKKLSKKSEVKVKNFMLSKKPDPLQLKKEIKIADYTKPTNMVKNLSEVRPNTNFTVDTVVNKKPPEELKGIDLAIWKAENGL